MSLSGDVFIGTLRTFRLCWLGGRVGGGKTALAVRLALLFYERGWVKHVIGNFPCVLFTDLNRLSDLRDTFVILDEAGVWMNEGVFDQVVAFLRKRNLYVVMPSYLSPPMRARSFNVMRTINAHRFGFNFWTYSGIVDYMRVKEKLSLVWFNPREVYGMWDTAYVAGDDAGIVDLFIDTFGEVGKRRKSQGSALSSGVGGVDVESLRRVSEGVAEAAEKISDSLSVAGRKTRSGGRRG